MNKVLISLVACLIFCAGIVDAQVYRETDRFTGKTSIYSTKKRITRLRAKAVYFAVYEKQITDILEHPESALIYGCFQEWGHWRWKYLEYHALIFLADGKSIIIDKTEWDGDADIFGNGKLGEKVYFWISWTNFLKLCNADKVEYKLGAYEKKLKSKILKEMCSFRDRILYGEKQ